jgi:hypothetical protein
MKFKKTESSSKFEKNFVAEKANRCKTKLTAELFKMIVKCDICKTFLALSMVSPLRCPGLDYNEKGQLVTHSGKKWSDIQKKHDEHCKKELQAYMQKHKRHLMLHGMLKI